MAGIGRNFAPVDAVDLLPASAATRLQNGRLRRDDASGAHRVVHDQIADLRAEKLDFENQLRRLQGAHRDNRARAFGGPAVVEEPAEIAAADAATRANFHLTALVEGEPFPVADLKKKIDRCFRDMQRLKIADDQRSGLFNIRARLINNVERFVRDIPAGVELQPLPEPAIKLGKANIFGEIEGRRRRLRELGADLRSVEAAPLSANAARAKMREAVEELAERGAPNVERLLFGGELELPQQDMRATPVFNDTRMLIAWQQIDAAAYITWANKDAILKKLDAEITTESADAPGISDEDRAAKLAVIGRDMLATAREECGLVELAHAQGMASVEFREDTDPVAFLNVEMNARR